MTRLAGVVWAACLLIGVTSQIASAQDFPMPAAAKGKLLFTGKTHLRNGGPACIGCHQISGIPFPNGGTLGPDLTGAYAKLGPTGTRSALQTLYFKVMTPIYAAHSLIPEEQVDLTAFLEQAGTKPTAGGTTPAIALAALILGGIFVGVTGLVWRGRVRSVRAAMVHRAKRRQGANS
ncbi:MAG TPA: hypothetical protein VG675_03800 [Bryobacteraceae bacterium]|nr:hypothetical protein [Bryobacteraceae bacterium]